MKNTRLETFDSQRFKSARGNDSLIDLAKLYLDYNGEEERFIIRIKIELRCFAKIEAWSMIELGWKEIHTIPGPLVPDAIDQALEQLTTVAIEIVKC